MADSQEIAELFAYHSLLVVEHEQQTQEKQLADFVNAVGVAHGP